MADIIQNEYLQSMKEELTHELVVAEKQNQSFRDAGLYPEYNMNDIILALHEQLETIDKIIKQDSQYYNALYPLVKNSESLILVEELEAKERDLIKETEGTTDLLDGLTMEFDEASETIDLLIENTIKNNRLEAMSNELKSDLSMTEDEIVNSLE